MCCRKTCQHTCQCWQKQFRNDVNENHNKIVTHFTWQEQAKILKKLVTDPFLQVTSYATRVVEVSFVYGVQGRPWKSINNIQVLNALWMFWAYTAVLMAHKHAFSYALLGQKCSTTSSSAHRWVDTVLLSGLSVIWTQQQPIIEYLQWISKTCKF